MRVSSWHGELHKQRRKGALGSMKTKTASFEVSFSNSSVAVQSKLASCGAFQQKSMLLFLDLDWVPSGKWNPTTLVVSANICDT